MTRKTPYVVLLEDNDIDYEIFTMIVKDLGFTVKVERFDRIEPFAKAIADSQLPEDISMVLCDLRLPDGNGLEVIQLLRSTESRKTTPIVVLSTSANPRDVTDCYSAGANAFHCKLTDLHELKDQLGKVLDYWLRIVITDERHV